MCELPSTPSNRTSTIRDIVYLHNKILECESVLEDRPYNEEARGSIDTARAQLEGTLLVPAIDTFTAEVKDASEKLSDWTLVVDVMVGLQESSPLEPDVGDARRELKEAVKGLAVIVLALREKFYV